MMYVRYIGDVPYSAIGDRGDLAEVQLLVHKHGILELAALGVTLVKIRKQFINIPMTRRGVVCWYGETAKFIIVNLDNS